LALSSQSDQSCTAGPARRIHVADEIMLFIVAISNTGRR
jgi:hypothetical protein